MSDQVFQFGLRDSRHGVGVGVRAVVEDKRHPRSIRFDEVDAVNANRRLASRVKCPLDIVLFGERFRIRHDRDTSIWTPDRCRPVGPSWIPAVTGRAVSLHRLKTYQSFRKKQRHDEKERKRPGSSDNSSSITSAPNQNSPGGSSQPWPLAKVYPVSFGTTQPDGIERTGGLLWAEPFADAPAQLGPACPIMSPVLGSR